MNRESGEEERSYWVVSPNVDKNNASVAGWRQASILGHAAFMGWPVRGHPIGSKFAKTIKPGGVILIARQHNLKPEAVGYGVVCGKYKTSIKGITVPGKFESVRKLSPFIPLSRAPAGVPFINALRHKRALVQLHPDQRKAHQRVCEWMEQQLSKMEKRGSGPNPSKRDGKKPADPEHIRTAALSGRREVEPEVHMEAQDIKVKKPEARLLQGYRKWLQQQDRKLSKVFYQKLRCDAFEQERRNLIEAKSSTNREHIRMAVGELLDYAYQGRKKFHNPHLAILLPNEPDAEAVEWLGPLNINLIWRKSRAFLDNANGQFT